MTDVEILNLITMHRVRFTLMGPGRVEVLLIDDEGVFAGSVLVPLVQLAQAVLQLTEWDDQRPPPDPDLPGFRSTSEPT